MRGSVIDALFQTSPFDSLSSADLDSRQGKYRREWFPCEFAFLILPTSSEKDLGRRGIESLAVPLFSWSSFREIKRYCDTRSRRSVGFIFRGALFCKLFGERSAWFDSFADSVELLSFKEKAACCFKSLGRR